MPYASDVSWMPLTNFPDTEKNVYFVVDNPSVYKMAGSNIFLVGVVCEPEAIAHGRDIFIKNHAKFDLLLTYDDEILKRCPNARMCLLGNTWISKSIYETLDVSKKQCKISCLTGVKELTPAHTYRKFLYSNQLRIPLPITWFRSSQGALLPAYQHNPIVHDDKSILLIDYQFSIAIENSRQTHYFTEKLLDCLVTRTIPIYYGCPNIADYFDTRGWIILETTNIDEFVYKVHNFLPIYEDCKEIIDKNYASAIKYIDLPGNIQRAMNLGAGTPANFPN